MFVYFHICSCICVDVRMCSWICFIFAYMFLFVLIFLQMLVYFSYCLVRSHLTCTCVPWGPPPLSPCKWHFTCVAVDPLPPPSKCACVEPLKNSLYWKLWDS